MSIGEPGASRRSLRGSLHTHAEDVLVRLLTSPLLVAPHGFTTRAGGVSTGPLTSLNLGHRPHEDPAALAENWRRVAETLGRRLPDVALLHQVHGARVVEVTAGGGIDPVADADAAFTRNPDVLLGVRVADCVPILLMGPGVVAVIHAGWRGIAAGVIGATVEAVGGSLEAVVGPCISADRYEVGPALVDAIGLPADRISRIGPRGRPHLDLRAAVGLQLGAAGVREVAGVDRCTATDPDLWSHRRDGEAAGRIAGVIALARPC